MGHLMSRTQVFGVLGSSVWDRNHRSDDFMVRVNEIQFDCFISFDGPSVSLESVGWNRVLGSEPQELHLGCLPRVSS